MDLELIKKKASEGFPWAIKRLKEIEQHELEVKGIVKEHTFNERSADDYDSAIERYDGIAWCIKEAKFRKSDEQEIKLYAIELMERKGYIKPVEIRIEYIKEPLKTSPEELEYKRWYDEHQKWLKENADKETRNRIKIKEALQRKTMFCYKCDKSAFKFTPEKTDCVIETKKKGRKKIIVTSNCINCHKQARAFGGYLE